MSRLTIAGAVFYGNDRELMASPAPVARRFHDITGWIEPPEAVVDVQAVPDGPGAYEPSTFHAGPRSVSADLSFASSDSSVTRAHADDWAGTLTGMIDVIMEDEHGVRAASAFMDRKPDPRRWNINGFRQVFYFLAPDPIKYGVPARFDGAVIENAGQTPVLPWRIVATGRATSILVVIGGKRTRWVGDSRDVTIDTRNGTATAGTGADVTVGLVEDNIPLLAPGATPMLITTDADSCVVEVRPGWL